MRRIRGPMVISRNKGSLVAGAVAASAVAGACVLVAPRSGDEGIERTWGELKAFRYAHRGLYDNRTPAPENSLAAFRLAREAGYGSELDVHLSADGVPVVIHDSDLRRACGTQGSVEARTADELGWLRLFGTKERIPTFEQVLSVYEEGPGAVPPLIVEVKAVGSNVAELTAKTVELLDRHSVPYCMESFDPRVLWWLRRHRPDIVRGQLSENFLADQQVELSPLAGIAHASLAANVLARPDFVAFRFEDRRYPSVGLACGLMGAKRVYWTVRTPEELAICEEEGAVAIFEGFEPEP